MLYEVEHIGRILEDLQEGIYSGRREVTGFRMKPCGYKAYGLLESDDSDWETYRPGDRWGGRDEHAWFRKTVTLSDEFAGRPVVFVVSTNRTGWDATNPQFMSFVNGRAAQGLDVNHREIRLTESARPGDTFRIDLDAYGGMPSWKDGAAMSVELISFVAVLEKETERLYYNLKVPLEVVRLLDPEDKRRIDTLRYLNTAVRMLDMRVMHSDDYERSAAEANRYLEEEFYGKFCGHGDVTETCVGHTHIDVAWLWTLAQTREKAVRSFSTEISLLKQYPEYVFMSSQPQLYQFVKEDMPEVYEEIRQMVRAGRWEPEGAMWLEADCNLISGESMVRQILYGTRFFREEFGAQCRVLWLPDVFGYSAALPQIMKKSGIDYFMTTKIGWNEVNTFPYDTFMWSGIDGTSVLTHFITTTDYDKGGKPSRNSTYNGMLTPSQVMGCWQRYQQKELSSDVLDCFGYGDGGGGPTREMIENARRLSYGIPGAPAVKLGKSQDFFRRLEKQVSGNRRLPKWVGELYLEFHRGTYTTMARNKRFNRKTEFLNRQVELMSVLRCLVEPGAAYPQEPIHHLWEVTLLNQFHDIIPGSSIRNVYEDSKAQYEAIGAEGRKLLSDAADGVVRAVALPERSAVVFNPLDFTRSDIVRFPLPAEWPAAAVFDGREELPVQPDGDGVLFVARGVPPQGYKSFAIRRAEAWKAAGGMTADSRHMENGRFAIRMDENACIVSLYDKANRREVLQPGQQGNLLEAFDDRPRTYDAWDIPIGYEEKRWDVTDVSGVEVTECGPVRASLKITRKFGESVIEQTMQIYDGIDRIDFDTVVDWKASHVLLKAAFPVDVHADKASFEIQYGNVERPTHRNTSWDVARFEVCAHKWADLSEAGYGVAMLNDCKYGCDIHDGVMRLSLLRSPTSPNECADREIHHFVYSLMPHAGGWREAKVPFMAYELNCPMTAAVAGPQEGILPDELSFLSTDCDNVLIEAVKKAEDDDGIIVRLYEYENRRADVRLTAFRPLSDVRECDLMENETAGIAPEGNSFTFAIKPYEIRTFKLRFTNKG